MKRLLSLAWLAAIAMLPISIPAQAQHADYDALVATHARANGVPEALVHRVIVRESRYRPTLVGRGGTIGLMQIKLATARGLGYTGSAEGLRDPDTNLTYAVKYLAGAYRAANGDHARAVHYYASGYYQAAKQQRLAHAGGQRLERAAAAQELEHAGNPQPALLGPPDNLADAHAQVSAAPHRSHATGAVSGQAR
jgi:soluble lytic murein transglycosylase-like protein